MSKPFIPQAVKAGGQRSSGMFSRTGHTNSSGNAFDSFGAHTSSADRHGSPPNRSSMAPRQYPYASTSSSPPPKENFTPFRPSFARHGGGQPPTGASSISDNPSRPSFSAMKNSSLSAPNYPSLSSGEAQDAAQLPPARRSGFPPTSSYPPQQQQHTNPAQALAAQGGAPGGSYASILNSNQPAASGTYTAPVVQYPSSTQPVEIDSLVLIKIIKHCRENYPVEVNGQLLGVDRSDSLEVTNCFALPLKNDLYAHVQKDKGLLLTNEEVEEKADEDSEKYQGKMTELMHDVSADCFSVGWYQTQTASELKSKDTLESLVAYQEQTRKAIMLLYDPKANNMGKMSAFKAYRVSQAFYDAYRAAEIDPKKYNQLRFDEILIEIPIVIKNALLTEAFILEYAKPDPLQSLADFDSLLLDETKHLESQLSGLATCVEHIMEEQDKLQYYQREYTKQQYEIKQLVERAKLENQRRELTDESTLSIENIAADFSTIPVPSQVNSLFLAYQASVYQKDIVKLCEENISKMFMLSKCSRKA